MLLLAKRSKKNAIVFSIGAIVILGCAAALGYMFLFMKQLNDGSLESGGFIVLPIAIVFSVTGILMLVKAVISITRLHNLLYFDHEYLYITKESKPSILIRDIDTMGKNTSGETNAMEEIAGKMYYKILLKKIIDIHCSNISENDKKEAQAAGCLFGILGFLTYSAFKNKNATKFEIKTAKCSYLLNDVAEHIMVKEKLRAIILRISDNSYFDKRIY